MINDILYVIGNGGHARSLVSLLNNTTSQIKHIGVEGEISDQEMLSEGHETDVSIVNGVGVIGANLKRRNEIYSRYVDRGFTFQNTIAGTVIMSSELSAQGVQIFHRAYIGPDVLIGNNTVINTGTIVEHDSNIGDSSFIGPGAIICGGVTIGSNVFIGAGAIILPDLNIPANTVIPAGTRFPILMPKNHKS